MVDTVIHIAGPWLEEVEYAISPFIPKIDGWHDTDYQRVTPEGGQDLLEAGVKALREAVKRGEQPIIFITAHGAPSLEDGAHQINLTTNTTARNPIERALLENGPQDMAIFQTTEAIEQLVEAYVSTYPGEKPPRLQIALFACHSEAVLRNLSIKTLDYADVLITDSQESPVLEMFAGKFLENISRGESTDDIFVRQLMTRGGSDKDILPAFALLHNGTQSVLDADALRDSVTPETLDSMKQRALKNIATLKPEFQYSAHQIIKTLDQAVLEDPFRIRDVALLGYLAASDDTRYVPLDHYRNDAAIITRLLTMHDPLVTLECLGQLDDNTKQALKIMLEERQRYDKKAPKEHPYDSTLIKLIETKHGAPGTTYTPEEILDVYTHFKLPIVTEMFENVLFTQNIATNLDRIPVIPSHVVAAFDANNNGSLDAIEVSRALRAQGITDPAQADSTTELLQAMFAANKSQNARNRD